MLQQQQQLQVHDPVTITRPPPNKNTLQGVVAYTGPVHFIDNKNSSRGSPSLSTNTNNNDWIGVRLTGPSVGQGKNNGTVQGRHYFTCPDHCGIFVRASAAQKRHLTRLEALRWKRELLAATAGASSPSKQQQQYQQKQTVGDVEPSASASAMPQYSAGAKSPLSSSSSPLPFTPRRHALTEQPTATHVVELLSSDNIHTAQTPNTTTNNPRPNVITPTTSTSPSPVNEHRREALRLRREILQERIATLKGNHDNEQFEKEESFTPMPLTAAATKSPPSFTTTTTPSHNTAAQQSPSHRYPSKTDTSTNKVKSLQQALLAPQQEQQQEQKKQQQQHDTEEVVLLHKKLMHAQQEALAAQNHVLEMEHERQEQLKSIRQVHEKNRILQDQLDKALCQLAETREQVLLLLTDGKSKQVQLSSSSSASAPSSPTAHSRSGTDTEEDDDSRQLHAAINHLREQLSQSQQELLAKQKRVQELEQENQLLKSSSSYQYSSQQQQETKDDLILLNQPLSCSEDDSYSKEERDWEICNLRDQLEENQRKVDNLKLELDRQHIHQTVDREFKFYCLQP